MHALSHSPRAGEAYPSTTFAPRTVASGRTIAVDWERSSERAWHPPAELGPAAAWRGSTAQLSFRRSR